MLKSVSLLSLSNVPLRFMYRGLWLLDFTSQFAPDSRVKAPLLSYLLCCHCQKEERGKLKDTGDRDRHAPPIDSQKWE